MRRTACFLRAFFTLPVPEMPKTRGSSSRCIGNNKCVRDIFMYVHAREIRCLARDGSRLHARWSFNSSLWCSRDPGRTAGPVALRARHINGAGDQFRAATNEEEWLQLDAKVNSYPSERTFKAIGTGGKEFIDLMVTAVQLATNQNIDRGTQVTDRPSKEGSYLAVSIRNVNVHSGQQVLSVYKEMKLLGGDRLKYII